MKFWEHWKLSFARNVDSGIPGQCSAETLYRSPLCLIFCVGLTQNYNCTFKFNLNDDFLTNIPNLSRSQCKLENSPFGQVRMVLRSKQGIFRVGTYENISFAATSRTYIQKSEISKTFSHFWCRLRRPKHSLLKSSTLIIYYHTKHSGPGWVIWSTWMHYSSNFSCQTNFHWVLYRSVDMGKCSFSSENSTILWLSSSNAH
jgi:hypothetical protein